MTSLGLTSRLLIAALIVLAAAAAPASAGLWLAGDLHVHTTYSHDSWDPATEPVPPDELYTLGHSTQSQFNVASSRGLHYLAITDHNDIRSQTAPGFGSNGVIAVPGYENSLDGHAQMLGARHIYDNGDKSAAAVNALAAALRQDPDRGVFQVNHPAEGTLDFPDNLDWKYAYAVRPDTVETWNINRIYQPPAPSASSNDDAVRYWEGWLDRGERVGATGGSDNHYLLTTPVQGAGQPTTWVYAADRSVRSILEGVRAGRTYISHQPPGMGGPGIFLEADEDGNGTYESRVGDTVVPGSRLRVRVTNASGSLLRVITDGGRQAFSPVQVSSSNFRHSFTLPAERTWVRAEVFDPDLAEERNVACDDFVGSETTYCRNLLLVTAMTSALYLRPDPPPPVPGRAGITDLPDDCLSRPFWVRVTGRAIERVKWYLDRQLVKTSERRNPRGYFALRVNTNQLEEGRHAVKARVIFKPETETGPKSLRTAFRVCGDPAG